MRSQQFGRRMRRFFVLRDHILSYHTTKPQSEEEVYANYSINSLHLTETSTAEIGRKMLMRSLIVNTPLDTLWVRSYAGSKEEAKWYKEINKSIQLQKKSKLETTTMMIPKYYQKQYEHYYIIING